MAAPTHSWFGAAVGSTTTILPAFPVSGTGVDAGDAVMARISSAALTGTGTPTTPSAPAGWTLVYSAWGGSGVTVAVGVGSRMISIYRRDTDATALETGSVTFANPGDSSYVYGWLYGIGKTAGVTLSMAGAFAQETADVTSYSEVMGSDPGVTTDDYLDHFVSSPLASGAWSAQAFSIPSVTVGTITERVDASTSSGHDERASHATGPVTSGTSTGAATMTATRSTASSGILVMLRVREVPPAPARRIQQPGFVAKIRASTW